MQTGNTVAGGPFAILQSAAMGGYGAGIVAAITRVAVGLVGGVMDASDQDQETTEDGHIETDGKENGDPVSEADSKDGCADGANDE